MVLRLLKTNGEWVFVNFDNVAFVSPCEDGSCIEFIRRDMTILVTSSPDSIYQMIKERELYKLYE